MIGALDFLGTAARADLQLRPAMRAGIVKDADAIVVAMNDKDRRLADLQRFEIPFVGNFRHMRQWMPFRAIKNALELRFVNVAPVEYILGDGVELRRPMNLRFRHGAYSHPARASLPEGIPSYLLGDRP